MKCLALAILMLLLAACAPSDEINIGYVGPLTGPVAHTGQAALNGFLLAHDLNPSAEGVQIDIHIEDDQCNPRVALTAARKLVEVEGVDVLVSGVCSSSTLALAPYAAQQDILLISAVAASPDISDAGPHVFRASSSSELMATQAAEALEERFSSIAIIQELDPYPVGWTEAFVSAWPNEVTGVFSFQSGENDLSAILLKAIETDSDAIFVITLSPPAAIRVLRSLKELGWEGPIIGNEAIGLAPVRNDPVSEGALVLSYEMDATALAQFEEQYEVLHGMLPAEERYSVLGSDAYLMLHSAFVHCGPDSACLQSWLESQDKITGIAGSFALDENGDAIRPFGLHIVREGNLEPVTS